MAKDGKEEVRKGSCPVCNQACHVRVYLENGRVVKITGDPDSPRGKSLCEKLVAAINSFIHKA